jgi:hypothetical protein
MQMFEYVALSVERGTRTWVTDGTLATLDPSTAGVLVIGVRRDGPYVGGPNPSGPTEPGDTGLRTGRVSRKCVRKASASSSPAARICVTRRPQ